MVPLQKSKSTRVNTLMMKIRRLAQLQPKHCNLGEGGKGTDQMGTLKTRNSRLVPVRDPKQPGSPAARSRIRRAAALEQAAQRLCNHLPQIFSRHNLTESQPTWPSIGNNAAFSFCNFDLSYSFCLDPYGSQMSNTTVLKKQTNKKKHCSI